MGGMDIALAFIGFAVAVSDLPSSEAIISSIGVGLNGGGTSCANENLFSTCSSECRRYIDCKINETNPDDGNECCDSVSAELAALSENITAIEQDISELESTTNALSESISGLNQDIEALAADDTVMRNKITDLETNVGEMQDSLNSHTASINQLKEDVQVLEEENSAQYDTLQTLITEIISLGQADMAMSDRIDQFAEYCCDEDKSGLLTEKEANCLKLGGRICEADGKCYVVKTERGYTDAMQSCDNSNGELLTEIITDMSFALECLDLRRNKMYWFDGTFPPNACPAMVIDETFNISEGHESCDNQYEFVCELTV